MELNGIKFTLGGENYGNGIQHWVIQMEPEDFANAMKGILADEQISSVVEKCFFLDLDASSDNFINFLNMYEYPKRSILDHFSLIDEEYCMNINEYIQEFEPFKERVKEAYDRAIYICNYLIKEKERIAEKQKHKEQVKPKRDYIKKNYEKLFVKLGKRDGFKCYLCGSVEELVIDHKFPVSRGGGNEDENLGLLCWTCNSEKSDKELSELQP
jgi:hypothetical protein